MVAYVAGRGAEFGAGLVVGINSDSCSPQGRRTLSRRDSRGGCRYLGDAKRTSRRLLEDVTFSMVVTL